MGTIPLGEDILLARHGSNIVKLRQDRKHRATVAYLRDGEIDTASNRLALASAPVMSPAASLSRGTAKYLNNETAVSCDEVRSLVKVTVAFSATVTLVFGGLLYALYRVGGDQAIASLSYMSGI